MAFSALLQLQTSDTTGKSMWKFAYLNSNCVLDGINNNKYDIGIVHDSYF